MTESTEHRWLEETQSAWIYARLVEVEDSPRRRDLFAGLGAATQAQAELLAADLRTAGRPLPAFVPETRARFVVFLARRFGTDFVRMMLPALKVRGVSAWDAPDAHAGGRRHVSSTGGAVRAAVFGINDGLVSNTSLLLGVAGAAGDTHLAVVSGLAGMVAGAFAMAAGEYISMASQAELFAGQIAEEREELERYPDEESEELALIYHARGLPLEDARALAKALVRHPQHALDVLAREELGVNPDDLGSPWGAAASSFVSFAFGAALPVAPFLLGVGPAVPVAIVLVGLALFAVGGTLSLYSGRGVLRGGVRMLAVGLLAGAATWAAGRLVGGVIG